jgi:hypothetical protein
MVMAAGQTERFVAPAVAATAPTGRAPHRREPA